MTLPQVISFSLCLGFALPALAQDSSDPAKSKKNPDPKQSREIEKPGALSKTDQAQQAFDQLSDPDWRVREKATHRLVKLGAYGKPFVQQGLVSSDPEVRLRCILVLRRPERLTERLITKMVTESHKDSGVKAFDTLAKSEDEFKDALIRKIHQYVLATENKTQAQRLGAALDVLSEIVTPADTKNVIELLRLNITDGKHIGSPFPILLEAIAKLPKEDVVKHAIEVLETANASPNAYQGSQACRVIGEFGDRKALPHLLKGLTHKGSITRMAVAKAMRTLRCTPEEAVALTPLLKDEDNDAIVVTLEVLAELDCRQAIPEILKLLKNDSESLVVQAITTLGILADPSAAAALQKILYPKINGTEEEIRKKLAAQRLKRGAAAWALARMKKVTSADLIQLIEKKEDVEFKAYLALGEVGDKASIDFLKTVASSMKVNAAKRTWAIRALSLTKDVGVSEFLGEKMLKKQFPRVLWTAAINGLRDQNTAASKKEIVKLLDSTDQTILAAVYDVVGDLDIRDAIPKLIKKLNGRTVSNANLSLLTTAMGGLGGKEIIEALKVRHTAERRNSTNKRYCAWALARAGETQFMKDIIAETKRSVTQSGTSLNRLGIDYLYGHDWTNARKTFRRMLWTNPKAQFAAYNLACVEGMRENKPMSLRFLRRSLDAWPSYWIGNWRHVATDPDLKSLHGEPAYEQLVNRLRWKYLMNESNDR
ncbi:MAG: HEAT repeat domain-containing protein [Planctomycetota bacterium]|nr:HEAT repeat domain-containing protein [Planctomycetota bacterium]